MLSGGCHQHYLIQLFFFNVVFCTITCRTIIDCHQTWRIFQSG